MLSVYSQYDHSCEKREALQRWAERIIGLVGSGPKAEIISLRGAQ